jgi:tetratricopeptide (TPR) repeat protein
MLRSLLLILLGLCFAIQPITGRTQSDNALVKEADNHFQTKDWAGAARAYESIAKAEPTNGRAWYRLGYSLHALGKYNQAVEAFKKAAAINSNPIVFYNLACAYSKNNEKEQALEWLNKSIEVGFNQPQQLSVDPDLSTIRDDSRFKEIVAKAERNAKPCSASLEFRQFDFWIGEWEVRNPQGQMVGTNSVQLILSDCVIFENWSGAGGGNGKSFNIYNSNRGKWQQTWVSDTGNVLELSGESKDGNMIFTGETVAKNGSRTEERLSFFKLSPDKVRQYWEQSTDGGKTWNVVFDGLYTRKK